MNATGSLARFQDAFSDALFRDSAEADPVIVPLAIQPAFAIYRNTVMKGSIDALQANFPAVTRLVGEEWLRAAAREFVVLQPPREPSLLQYGKSFPTFLSAFSPADELPYLADVGRLDRLWTEAHVSADGPVLDPQTFRASDPAALAHSRLVLHPSARWRWFPEMPIYTIWSRNREDDADGSDIKWRGEGALLARPHGAVVWRLISESASRFLDACAAGLTVMQAMEAALEVDADVDLVNLISNLVEAGAFSRLIQTP